jgi:trehalose 6-phosphate phosphatase
MEFRSDQGRKRYDAFVAAGAGAMVGLDFDGTLAPIVADPEQARIHPKAPDAIVRLATCFPTLAIITGRPVSQVLELGDLLTTGEKITAAGGELLIFGHYGNESWTSRTGELESPEPPEELVALKAELPALLAEADTPDAWVEDKGLAVALHTRRCAEPANSYERLLPIISRAAASHGLDVEPGRLVIEVRRARVDKGSVVRDLAEKRDVDGFCFVGDDLGDLAAFEAVTELSERGLPTLLVASESAEESALVALADVVVPGPSGVADFLIALAEDAKNVH